ncbi:hypothetical protein [Kineococcus sp. R86509]|uniref:hypothetical protein n=1 Tax=Kineococcus sp. R86509 TaxID=3093851 RepID=UPI0036D31E06
MTTLDTSAPSSRNADARVAAAWVLALCGILLAVLCGWRLAGVAGQVYELHWLRENGTRFTGVVVEEGLTRPDGSMTSYGVQAPGGRTQVQGEQFFVDATWSPTPVTAKGQRVDVAVDPRDRSLLGLPADSLHHGWVLEGLRAGLPSGLAAAAFLGGAVLVVRRWTGSLLG